MFVFNLKKKRKKLNENSRECHNHKLQPIPDTKTKRKQDKMSYDTTKPTKWMCAQRRLRSAWASTQSDQSSLCAQWVAKDPRFLHADSGLIRLGGCPCWSASSLDAQSFCWFCHEAAQLEEYLCGEYGFDWQLHWPCMFFKSTFTHICLVDRSILINWTNPFPILGVSGVLFHVYSISKRYSCSPTVKTLIRRRDLHCLPVSQTWVKEITVNVVN